MTYTWQVLKDNIIDGQTSLEFERREAMQIKYHEARQYTQSLKFRNYSDFIKIKHLAYKSNVNANGVISSRKTKCSLPCKFVENEYPYYFTDETIKHYLIWSVKPLDHQDICDVVLDSKVQYTDMTWFVNTTAKKSVKDLWHCHIFLKKN